MTTPTDADRECAHFLFRQLVADGHKAAVMKLDVTAVDRLTAAFAAVREEAREEERAAVIRIIEAKHRQYDEAAKRSGFADHRGAADVLLRLILELTTTTEARDEN